MEACSAADSWAFVARLLSVCVCVSVDLEPHVVVFRVQIKISFVKHYEAMAKNIIFTPPHAPTCLWVFALFTLASIKTMLVFNK